MRRGLVGLLLLALMATTWQRPARADETTYEYYYGYYRCWRGHWHRRLCRRPIQRVVTTPVVPPAPLPAPPAPETVPAVEEHTAEAPFLPPEPPPPPPPPLVRVAVSESARRPSVEGFPVAIDARGFDPEGQAADGFRVALVEAVLGGGLHVASSAEAGLRVNAEARARAVRELGAGRTQVETLGTVEVGIVEGGRPLHVAPLRVASDADASAQAATREGLEALGAEAGRAVVETVREHVSSIRVREIHVATDDLDLTSDALAAPLLEGLAREPHVLVVRRAGAARGGIAWRGPSARVEVWLAPEFAGSLQEVVRGVLLASESAREVEYEIGSVQ